MAFLKRRPVSLVWLTAALPVLSAACDGTGVQLQDDLYAVHSLLIAGAGTATVQVTRNDPRLPLGEEGLSGASVRLLHATDTLTLREAPANELDPPDGLGGRYTAAVPNGILAGGVYELLVELPTGSARGVTRVLHPPRIISPDPGLRVSVEEGSVWVPVDISAPSAAGARVMLRSEVLYRGGTAVGDPNCRFPAGAEASPPPSAHQISGIQIQPPVCLSADLTQPAEWDSLDVQLIAVAYDSAYVRYAERTFEAEGAYIPYVSVGIEGALGFFSNGAEESVPVRIVKGSLPDAGRLGDYVGRESEWAREGAPVGHRPGAERPLRRRRP